MDRLAQAKRQHHFFVLPFELFNVDAKREQVLAHITS